MKAIRERATFGLMVGVSIFAIATPHAAFAQTAQDPASDPAGTNPAKTSPDDFSATDTGPDAPAGANTGDDIVITGIRASLRESMNIKRNAEGVVDAISAEDMGKFPDSNLAESLQRITGVSIDRSNGEGQYVTVRGFGQDFNLVTLNGRTMPTSTLGDGVSAPSTRAFDFANLASEGISAVEVYKTSRASIPSGGIGSTINIRTTRPLDAPGLKASVSAKAVYDTSVNNGTKITPELSGIVSNTFADDTIGVSVSASYQNRKASLNNADVLYQSWATVTAPDGSWAYGNANPAPDNGSIVQTPITMGYSVMDINRTRVNGQATLQFRPMDTLTVTADYTLSSNKVEADMHRIGLWFARSGALSSGWDPGNPAPPLYFKEDNATPTDIALEASRTANKNLNHSLGLNAAWQPTERLTLELDGHRSTAKSSPDSKYGSSQSVQAAIFGASQKRIDFTTYLPQINYTAAPGVDPNSPAGYFATGNSFRNGLFTDKIVQGQARGRYDFDTSFLDSLDFGVGYTDNKTRSAFGVYEQAAWGGQGTAADLPDDIFYTVTVPDKFDGLDGANGDVVPSFLAIDTDALTKIFIDKFGACNGGPDCLAPYDRVDSRVRERTLAPYLQLNNKFDIAGNPAHLNLGLRYERTKVTSTALASVPYNTAWVSANEFNFLRNGNADFTTLKGDYKKWLPNIDFDMSPMDNVKLRASYSHSIARASYAQLQGGLSFNGLRAVGGFAGSGNPGLLPYLSKNIDLSVEYYYGKASYVSAGFFHKTVSDFPQDGFTNSNLANLRTVIGGPRYLAAVAAGNTSPEDIRQYIFDNYASTTNPTGTDSNGYTTGEIFALPEDPLINFEVTLPVNSDAVQKIHGFEFAIQHNFWDTGFGAILNYTIVGGGGKYNNQLLPGAVQNGVQGLSNSANIVGFYDKNGLQARVAYNWRDKFLAAGGQDPSYVEAYGQVDASASYEFRKGWTVFAEGINLTGQSRRGYSRTKNNVQFVQPGFARYAAGLRYTF